MSRHANKCGKARRWCFTVNNYTAVEEQCIKALTTDTVQYLICGYERGEEKATPHLQGAVVWKSARTLTAIKSTHGFERAHLEVMRGDIGASEEYCSKEGDFFEIGVAPISKAAASARGGAATAERYEELWSLAKDGKMEEIEPDLRVKHYATIRSIRKDYGKRPADLALPAGCRVGVWIWGVPGAGKSRWIRHFYGGDQLYDKQLNKWWDGYTDERYVVLDDLDVNHAVLGSHIKRWADRYAFPAEWKGGKTDIRPELVFVTSNYSPEEIWEDPKQEQILAAIKRRFTVVEFKLGAFYDKGVDGLPRKVNYDPYDQMEAEEEQGYVSPADMMSDE